MVSTGRILRRAPAALGLIGALLCGPLLRAEEQVVPRREVRRWLGAMRTQGGRYHPAPVVRRGVAGLRGLLDELWPETAPELTSAEREEIEGLVLLLAADDPAARVRATRRLDDIGPRATVRLARERYAADPELRSRIEVLLERWEQARDATAGWHRVLFALRDPAELDLLSERLCRRLEQELPTEWGESVAIPGFDFRGFSGESYPDRTEFNFAEAKFIGSHVYEDVPLPQHALRETLGLAVLRLLAADEPRRRPLERFLSKDRPQTSRLVAGACICYWSLHPQQPLLLGPVLRCAERDLRTAIIDDLPDFRSAPDVEAIRAALHGWLRELPDESALALAGRMFAVADDGPALAFLVKGIERGSLHALAEVATPGPGMRLHPPPPALAAALEKPLKSADLEIRETALNALAVFSGEVVVSRLISLLADDNDELAVAAARALTHQTDAALLRAKLREALRHPIEKVRTAAQEVLDELERSQPE